MDSTGITPVMNMGGEGMFGGNGFIAIFGLLILLALINGGGILGGGNGNVNALNADMQRGFDQQNTMYQTGNILTAVNNGTAQTIAASTQNAANAITAIKDGNANIIREFGNVETALTAMGGQMQNCCCEVLRSIDASNYNTTTQIQKVLDAIAGNRMADMQNQINKLELQNATAGMLRFPSAWTYAGGVFPPIQTTTAA